MASESSWPQGAYSSGVTSVRWLRSRIDPENVALLWVRSVAHGTDRGARGAFLYAPSGMLADTLPVSRAVALTAGMAVFYAAAAAEAGVGAAALR